MAGLSFHSNLYADHGLQKRCAVRLVEQLNGCVSSQERTETALKAAIGILRKEGYSLCADVIEADILPYSNHEVQEL